MVSLVKASFIFFDIFQIDFYNHSRQKNNIQLIIVR